MGKSNFALTSITRLLIHALGGVLTLAIICVANVEVHSQPSKTRKKPTPSEESTAETVVTRNSSINETGDKVRKFNAYCSPVEIVLSGFSDIDFGLDYKIAEFMTVGIGYRSKSGTSSGLIAEIPQGTSLSAFRIQAEAYTAGSAFKSSFVVQLKHTWNTFSDQRTAYTSSYALNGLGALVGWRWFWTDPGEIGLNVSLLAGGSRLTVSEVSTDQAVGAGVVPELRVDLGYAF